MILQKELVEYKVRKERYQDAKEMMEKFKEVLDESEVSLIERVEEGEDVETGEFAPRLNEVSRFIPSWKNVAIHLFFKYENISADQAEDKVRSETPANITMKLELISDKAPLEVQKMLTDLMTVTPAVPAKKKRKQGRLKG